MAFRQWPIRHTLAARMQDVECDKVDFQLIEIGQHVLCLIPALHAEIIVLDAAFGVSCSRLDGRPKTAEWLVVAPGRESASPLLQRNSQRQFAPVAIPHDKLAIEDALRFGDLPSDSGVENSERRGVRLIDTPTTEVSNAVADLVHLSPRTSNQRIETLYRAKSHLATFSIEFDFSDELFFGHSSIDITKTVLAQCHVRSGRYSRFDTLRWHPKGLFRDSMLWHTLISSLTVGSRKSLHTLLRSIVESYSFSASSWKSRKTVLSDRPA